MVKPLNLGGKIFMIAYAIENKVNKAELKNIKIGGYAEKRSE